MSVIETATYASPTAPAQVLPFALDRQSGTTPRQSPDIAALQRIESKIRFTRGEVIFSEGDPAEFAYRVVTGTVRLCKHTSDGRRQISQFLLPGDYFSFLEMAGHSFTAEAVGDVVLAACPQRQIERLCEERPGLRRFFTSLLSRRVKDVQNHLVILGRQTAKEKMASFLVMLIDRGGTENGSHIALDMGRQDIADFLGLTIETVCRVLSIFKREKLISLAGLHEVVIRDIDALYRLADAVPLREAC